MKNKKNNSKKEKKSNSNINKIIYHMDVVVIRWRTSCYKNRMTTRVITLWRVDVASLTTYVVNNAFFLLRILLFLRLLNPI